jgi:hypothetical protein
MGPIGRHIRLRYALLFAALLVVPPDANAGTGYAPLSPHGFHRAKVRTDGLLTVGGQETLTVKGVSPKQRLKASISPPPTATACFPDTFAFAGCFPEPLYRVAGTPRFKGSGKGRATLTFVMPPAYEYLDLDDPLKSHPVYLVDGQTVHVDIAGISVYRRPHTKSIVERELGSSIAVVQVPPAPTP